MGSDKPRRRRKEKESPSRDVDTRRAGPKDSAPEAFATSSASSPVPVVGVGASAGGLEALAQMLRALPVDTGAAFVLIQHLAPKRPSALTEILSRATAMPVAEVVDDVQVQKDRVYVIPPDSNVLLAGDRLKLVPREPGAKNLPIDQFLRSLAESHGHMAVGVVLSGTGTDGTLGLEEIKAEGGITFAQDDTAQQGGMPQSAVASGCVDFLLSPEGIAGEIAEITKHPYVLAREGRLAAGHDQTDSVSEEKETFAPVLDLLQRATKVDFRGYRANTLSRRIRRRMLLKKQEGVEEYARLLQSAPSELQDLYQDILISVTSFFRDPETFEILKTTVIPTLLRDRAREESFRVWMPACSTGEETYSLAMVLCEVMESLNCPAGVQIFATDLCSASISHARAGVYSAERLQHVSRERTRRFFVERDGRFQVNKTLRDMCVFAAHNALSDPPFSRMDLVTCRNLLIYLEPALQRHLISILHYALKPTGYLVLGASETIGALRDLFHAVDAKHKVFAKKPASGRVPIVYPGRRAARVPLEAREHTPDQEGQFAAARSVGGGVDVHKEADRLLLERFSPAAVLVGPELQILQFRGNTGPFLTPPQGKATFALLRMAHPDLLAPLRVLLSQAQKEGAPVRQGGLRIRSKGEEREVELEVLPVEGNAGRDGSFLILFKDAPPAVAKPAAGKKGGRKPAPAKTAAAERLERELASSREYAHALSEQHDAAIEALQAAHEEVQSANEELQSINEELETSKEEIQSSNEELTTVNDELNHRNLEITQLNGDLVNLIESIQVAIVIVGRDLTLRRYSPAAGKLLGILPGDVGRPISALRSRVVPLGLDGLLAEVIDRVSTLEQEVLTEGGRWYSLRVRPYQNLENKIDGAVLMLVDIDTIRRAREHGASIIATVREPLLVLDSDLRVRFANSSFYTFFGVGPEETEGRLIDSLWESQWSLPSLRHLLEKIATERASFEDFVLEGDFKGLGQRTLLLNARRLPAAQDGSPEILLAIADITERKHNEEARAKLAAIVEASDDAIVSETLEGLVTSWNPGAERLYGYRAEEIIGEPAMTIIPPDRQAEEAEILRRLCAGERIASFETVRVSRGGERIEVSVSMAAVVDEAGRIVGASIIGRDISERRRLEAELRARIEELAQQDRERNNFLAVLSHELRSPINAICGWIHVLRKDDVKPAIMEQGLAAIDRNSQSQASLLADLMDVHRIASGKLRLEAAEIDLSAVIAGAMEDVLPAAREKGIHLERTGDLRPTKLFGDPNRLQQVFWNLLSNSIKFTPPGGEIRVALHRAGKRAEVSVIDTGVGISTEAMPYLFERFRQADPSTSRSHGGLGLGLAIVKQLVELHGGGIRAQSAGKDKGATFTLTFPIRSGGGARRPQAISQPGSKDQSLVLGGVKVLVVDDEADAREPLRRALEGAGAEVITASSADEAIEGVRQQRPDVVVSDIGMPERDGYDLVRSIRTLPPGKGGTTPSIALTSYASPRDRDQALRAGFDVHLAKPVAAAELVAAVAALLPQPRGGRIQT